LRQRAQIDPASFNAPSLALPVAPLPWDSRMPEQPKRSFVGLEPHLWPNFDLRIVDGALSAYDRTENFVIVGKVTLTGGVATLIVILPTSYAQAVFTEPRVAFRKSRQSR